MYMLLAFNKNDVLGIKIILLVYKNNQEFKPLSILQMFNIMKTLPIK